MSSLEKDVIDIVVEQLGVDAADVTLDKSFIEDLNADSLDLTELIMTFEERFGFEISEEEAEKLKTVGDVVSFIQKKKHHDHHKHDHHKDGHHDHHKHGHKDK